MNNNLEELRVQSGLSAKELAKLLNVTVHTYIAFEQDRMTVPEIAKVMLGKIYLLPSNAMIDKPLKLEYRQKVSELKNVPKEERWEIVVSRLFGKIVHVSYRCVRALKEEMFQQLNENEDAKGHEIDKRKSD